MTKEQQIEQLKLAAAILETGHPFEWKNDLLDWHSPGDQSSINYLASYCEIRPILATPPDGRALHNPGNLTAEQVGIGYRLLLPEEADGRHKSMAEMWCVDNGWRSCLDAKGKIAIYRVPLSTPWPEAAKDEPAWILWNGGECPLKDDEVEEWEREFRDGVRSRRNGRPSAYFWRHDNDDFDIIAYRVLKWKTPKQKVPLEACDVPPGSVIRFVDENLRMQWITIQHLGENGIQIVSTLSAKLEFISWKALQISWQINRSIPITGKWNPDAWEACEKEA